VQRHRRLVVARPVLARVSTEARRRACAPIADSRWPWRFTRMGEAIGHSPKARMKVQAASLGCPSPISSEASMWPVLKWARPTGVARSSVIYGCWRVKVGSRGTSQ
jgi:hypothetical protein